MKKFRPVSAGIVVVAVASALVQTVCAQNFSLTLQPNSVTLIPGKTTSFLLSLTPLAGFTSPVALAVGTLPAGVSASFSPNPVTLPGTSLLTLSATTNAVLGSFTLDVTGSGGGVTNTTSSSVTVNFGLLPLCTGGFQGAVTDIETGLPVLGATVYASFLSLFSGRTDGSGQYIFTNIQLAPDNLPALYSLYATRTDYWSSASISAEAVCDVTNRVNFQILRQRYGSINGIVTDTGGHPLPGVTVGVSGGSSVSTSTDANGFFQSSSLMLGSSNSPTTYIVQATTNGYWLGTTNTTVVAGSNSVVHLVLIPICTSTVTGRVIYGDTGLPAANVSVQVTVIDGGGTTNTDANGDYAIPGIPLGRNNSPDVADIVVNVTGYNFGQTNAPVTNCLEIVVAPTLVLQPLPRNNFGSVAGYVYDVETGLPLTNALVHANGTQGAGGSAFVDTNGAYLVTNVFVGTGGITRSLAAVTVTASDYFQSSSNFTLFAGQTVTQDVRVLRMRFGEVSGVVRDSATHLPVSKVLIDALGTYQIVTGQDGHYDIGPIPLNFPNVPTFVSLSATATGYWPTGTNTTITADTTNVVDIDLIQVCTGATIVGNVVNATTQQPITNATVSVSSAFQFAQTDAGGNFILTNITVGNNNSPIQTTVTATAPGFNSQSRTVTIFCDASITTEFGAPQTTFGAIEGYVTNVLTGLPLTNVFIGSQFGAATSTDTNGYYRLEQAPLGANGADRTWTITALPTGFPPQTKPVAVSSNTVSRLDFGFGQAPALLAVTVTAEPDPVDVGSNLVYTVTLRNTAADAANVQLIDRLPATVTFVSAAVTNFSGDAFGAPVFSNSVVRTTSSVFASNDTAQLLVTVTPTIAGTLTNLASVSSDTPDIDVTGSNRTAAVTTIVNGSAPLVADVGITLTGSPNPVFLGNDLTYTLIINNAGPADAPDVVVTDSLPATVSFVSASPSQGSVTSSTGAVRWEAGPLTNGASATASIVVSPLVVGPITNTASAAINTASVTDFDPDNDAATVTTMVDAPGVTNVSVQPVGPIVFDPQTGLFEQSVGVNNLGSSQVAAVRLAVLGLPADVTLYNASGISNGVPFVEYDSGIGPGASADLILEYYHSNRLDFVSTNFSVIAVAAATPIPPTGTTLQLDRDPFLSNGKLVIEFAGVPGVTYVVQYSADMQTWETAVPPVIATGSRVQWIDAGPPKTDSPPGAPGQRFYRVVQLP